MHAGLPCRPQLAKLAAIRRRGRGGWRMRVPRLVETPSRRQLPGWPPTEHPPQPAGGLRRTAPHARGSGLNASAISSSQNRMCGCSTVRSVRGAGQQMAPGQCIASHGRLTACLSRLMRYPDRADDRRASLFLRRGILCMLACVVKGS